MRVANLIESALAVALLHDFYPVCFIIIKNQLSKIGDLKLRKFGGLRKFGAPCIKRGVGGQAIPGVSAQAAGPSPFVLPRQKFARTPESLVTFCPMLRELHLPS
jgi:hypothetical protein